VSATVPDHERDDEQDDGDQSISDFGYKPQLKRTLGNFHTFAAGISYISILTGTFQLFNLGVGFGGPAYWWSWPMVFVGQLMVALCFCELAARYPVAGSVYNWSKKLGGEHLGWLGGWMMVTATMVSLSAVALAYQQTLPQISSVFWVIGDGSQPADAAKNAVFLGSCLIVFTTLVNAFGVKLMARINSAGVLIELIAAVVLICLLAAHFARGLGTITDTHGLGSGRPFGYFGPFLTASLASAYVMYGFDTASSLGEESKNPSRNAPRAILRALVASFLIGGLILLFALLAVPDLNSSKLGTDGLQFVVLSTLGSSVGQAVLWCVFIAITVCELAVHTAGIRLAFAMARDNGLPASSWVAKVSPRFQTPIVPAVVIGLVAIGILVININQPQIFSVVTSIAIIMIYLAYLSVTVPMLWQRLRGNWQPVKGHFSLGKFGLPVNIIAVLWGTAMAVNLAWPRASIYNAAPPHHWYLQWGAFLYIGVIAGAGFIYYWFRKRGRINIIEGSRAAVPDPEQPAAP
jgi:urea carboxylase system permease